MPCYRCGTRQADPEPGKPSAYRRGVIAEHQVLICPACQPAAAGELTRCSRCDGGRLIRRLDQIECLDCGLVREPEDRFAGTGQEGGPEAGAGPEGGSGMSGAKGAPDIPDISLISDKRDPGLAADVARALERMRPD